MMLTVKDLDKLAHIEFRNRERLNGVKVTGVSTDSRWVEVGEVFFALKGENFNGHKFVSSAFDKGAAAAIVDRSFGSDDVPDKPVIVVEDTTRALGALAHFHRMKFNIPIIAVGGSNGKTTTKDMISSVLESTYRVLCTQGNLNNHIGVPQTLLRLEKKHKIAVIEIGTNHPGEIDYLCGIVSPTHGLITNVGREHLEFFKSVDGVTEEEGTLFDYLRRKSGSVVFVNADDAAVRSKAKRMRRQVLYGMHAKGVRVGGTHVRVDEKGRYGFEYLSKTPNARDTIHLQIPGEHNTINALAAVAVGLMFKVPPRRIRKSLELFRPTAKRMEVLNFGGVSVINDTYNANPDSMIAALRTLASTKVSGKKIAVLADMRELGERSEEEHASVGREAARLGIDYVLTYGDLAREIHRAIGTQGAIYYDQKNVLAEYLSELVAPGDVVLVKGSRGMKMEDVVTFLEERLHSASLPSV